MIMLRRFGFRRILPLSFFALHVVLSAYGYYHQPVADSLARTTAAPRKHLHLARTETPTSWDFDIALNLPAFVFGFILVLLTRTGSNISTLICASPFVLILWLLIGRWLDWQLGWIPFSPRKRLLQGISIGGIVLTGMTLLLMLASGSNAGENPWPAVTLACWTLAVLGISIVSLVRSQEKKRSPKAALS